MSYNKNKRKKPTKPEKKYSLPLLIPIIALMTVVPMIVFMHQYNTGLSQYDWYSSETDTVDFFLYDKMVCIIIACVIMVFCMVYMFFAEERRFVWIKNLIPMAVYCGISFVSALTSINRHYSFSGIFEQFESVWVLLGYGIIVYYVFFHMREKAAVERTLNWFTVGIGVMCALGLTQVFKHDFIQTDAGRKLISPSTYDSSTIAFNFEPGRPYLTLYNPNYVGYYAALIIPVLLALIFASKKLWMRISYGVLIAALLYILFASQSRAGIVALALSLVVMVLCMRKIIIRKWYIALAGIALIIIAFFGVNAMNDNVLLNRLKGMFTTTAENHPLKSIVTEDDNVAIHYNDGTLRFYVTQDSDGNDVFQLLDHDKKEVACSGPDANGNYSVDDYRFPFSFCSSRAENFNGFVVNIDGQQWFFTNLMKEGDSTFYVMGGASSLFKLQAYDSGIKWLEEHYSFANNRGYIWARTIPLLKKYFFLGSGPDTFIIAFPNNDLVGMYNSGHANEIMTKPHNMYLQVGVQTGIFSLLALVTFFGWYLVSCIRIYWKSKFDSYMSLIGVGIFAAVIGYLILALTNDSTITVSPIFYCLIGMGLGINYTLKQELKKAQPATAKQTK